MLVDSLEADYDEYATPAQDRAPNGYKLYRLAYVGAEFLYNDATPQSWSNVCRQLDIDGLMDNGAGVFDMTSTEWNQGVIFSRAAIVKGTEISLNAPDEEKDLDVPPEHEHKLASTKALNRAKAVKHDAPKPQSKPVTASPVYIPKKVTSDMIPNKTKLQLQGQGNGQLALYLGNGSKDDTIKVQYPNGNVGDAKMQQITAVYNQ